MIINPFAETEQPSTADRPVTPIYNRSSVATPATTCKSRYVLRYVALEAIERGHVVEVNEDIVSAVVTVTVNGNTAVGGSAHSIRVLAALILAKCCADHPPIPAYVRPKRQVSTPGTAEMQGEGDANDTSPEKGVDPFSVDPFASV